MVYSTAATKRRASHLRRVIEWGTKLILFVVGIDLFRTEFSRVMALPRELNNELYLTLLAAATLLTVGWIFVADKEVEIMCDFLAPSEYKIPDETVLGMAIAAALVILLYTARNPLWFGISYSVYMLLSVFAWKRLIREMDKAIRGSRRSLKDEPKHKRDTIGGALDILDSYYLRRPNMLRVWTSFGLAVLGLIFSIVAFRLGRTIFNTFAYLIFILSIVALEGVLAFRWRFKLYHQVEDLEPAEYDLDDAKHRKGAGESIQAQPISHPPRGEVALRKLQIVWGAMLVISGVATTLGLRNVSIGNASGFCPWFWWMGIFTWDDALIIGAFLFLATGVMALKQDSALTTLIYSFYGVLRTGIEALYNLNAQFSPITRPWEANLPAIAAHFHLKLVELFVVAQVFYTVLCVALAMVFVSSLKRYLRS